MVAASELPLNMYASAWQMAQTIFGSGVTVTSASYTGDWRSSAVYSDGDAVSPGVTPSDTGVILSTGSVSGFTNGFGDANQSPYTSTDTWGVDRDAQFDALAGAPTYDAAWLDVDFIPDGNVMTLQFVFASEEYPEYVNTAFHDAVGVWVNGTEVPLGAGDGDIDPDNINPASNENLFLDNTASQFNTEMDGLTVTMTLTVPVNPGVVNSIRIGIADVGDSVYDSSLLIAGNSGQTTLVAESDQVMVFPNGTRVLDVLANDINGTGGSLTITHINGVAVTAGSTVTLASGHDITLNADGTLTIDTDADISADTFTYTVQSSTGHSDTGFVTVDTVPCFVAGTMIRVPGGEVPVENLSAGDVVLTMDDGAQPLIWTGARSVPAQGALAPVRIAAGTFGRHRTLLVSPQHRILIRDSLAELLFGTPEVLIKAKDLVNGRTVTRVEGGEVSYVHLLFERHQVVFSQGLSSESFLPGPTVLNGMEDEAAREIRALFPDAPGSDLPVSPARRPLRSHEARALLGGGQAA